MRPRPVKLMNSAIKSTETPAGTRKRGSKPAAASGSAKGPVKMASPAPLTHRKLRSSERSEGSGSRGQGQGGQRLAEAMDEAATLPALAESVDRIAKLLAKGPTKLGEMIEAVESEAALAITVLRIANNRSTRARVTNIPDAVAALDLDGMKMITEEQPIYEFFQTYPAWQGIPERFRRHSLATRHAAERIADLGSVAGRDELVTAALLHDVGTLVLTRLYPAYEDLIGDRSMSPEDRVGRERRELGVDHALVGGVLLRRWKVPQLVATAVERHHSDGAEGLAAAVRLADMVAHHGHGEVIDPDRMKRMAERCSISRERLRRMLYEFPYGHVPRQRPTEPCPLSAREVDALRGLAEGKVYKEIAEEMGLSASTVRTHLHNVYRKIGAADRAQAVLLARERAWI